MNFRYYLDDNDRNYSSWNYPAEDIDQDADPDPQVSLENEIGKLIEIFLIGLTGKNLDEQRPSVRRL